MRFVIGVILEIEMDPADINFQQYAKLLTTCRDQNKLPYKTADIDLINEAISKLELLHIIIKQLRYDEEKERQRTQRNLPILLTSKSYQKNTLLASIHREQRYIPTPFITWLLGFMTYLGL